MNVNQHILPVMKKLDLGFVLVDVVAVPLRSAARGSALTTSTTL